MGTKPSDLQFISKYMGKFIYIYCMNLKIYRQTSIPKICNHFCIENLYYTIKVLLENGVNVLDKPLFFIERDKIP